jgi:3-oxoacyl-[acyl-carrier-protein] synthase II
LESEISKNRIGVIWGTGNGGASTYDQTLKEYFAGSTKKTSPYFVPKVLLDTTSGIISIKHGLKGVNYTTVSACASGSTAIVDAFNYIRWGKADAIVAGGSDAPICESLIAGFNALKALSTRNDDFHIASRPFDTNRDGFVMGEGGVTFVIESLDSALARDATIIAEIVGGGINADAYHMTAGHPDGEGAIACMNLALEEAGIGIESVDYLNAHATSTPVGDLAESNAIIKLTERKKMPWIGATKSMTGHLMGAAGALEAAICALSVARNIIPPNINLFELDPKINQSLRVVGSKAIYTEVNYAFGGHNSAVIVKKYIP